MPRRVTLGNGKIVSGMDNLVESRPPFLQGSTGSYKKRKDLCRTAWMTAWMPGGLSHPTSLIAGRVPCDTWRYVGSYTRPTPIQLQPRVPQLNVQLLLHQLSAQIPPNPPTSAMQNLNPSS